MPDVVECPSCNSPVSKQAVVCRSCGEQINDVPDAISLELLESLLDTDVADVLFQYAVQVLTEEGCHKTDGTRAGDALAKLPRGIRAAYTLVMLDSEMHNGGFWQWFTNSSGELRNETLEDVRFIAATKHTELLQKAMALNNKLESKYPSYKHRWDCPEPPVSPEELQEFCADVEANFEPAFSELDDEFYSLEETESFWTHYMQYIRENPECCVHQR